MCDEKVLIDIPDSDVDQIVEDFESEGCEAQKVKQPNGLWKIIVNYP